MSNEEAEEQAKHEEELNIGKENSQSVSFPQNNVPPPTPQRLESATVGGVGTNRGPPTSIPQSIEEHESDIDDQKHVVVFIEQQGGSGLNIVSSNKSTSTQIPKLDLKGLTPTSLEPISPRAVSCSSFKMHEIN